MVCPPSSVKHRRALAILSRGASGSAWLGLIAGWVVLFGVNALPADASSEPPVEIIVSAASSLTDAFEALGREFERLHPDIGVAWNFSGSNHLQRQIEAVGGRGVDVFAPAGEEPMMALVTLGLVDKPDVRFFASNTIVLICPKNNPADIHAFEDLLAPRVERIAVAAPGVPVGRYAEQVLRHLRLDDVLERKFVFGIHARQVLDYVARGEVESGLVYATDAAMTEDVAIVAEARPEWHAPIRYPIAVLNSSQQRPAAVTFVEYTTSPEGTAILARYGFLPPAAAGDVDRALSRGRPLSVSQDDERSRYGGAWSAMKLSLIAAAGAMLVVLPLGTALGALIAKRAFPGRELLDSILTLPMILPPTVTGYYLIILLGSHAPLGRWLGEWFGIRIPLTIVGAAVASAVIALPLMIKSARAAFESVNPELELASHTLGKSRLETMLRVTLPLARHGLVAGAILSFARAIGEFGATFMLAGIIPGRTMTMPSAIFHAFTNHDDKMVQFLVLILTVFSVLVIYLTNRLNARQSARMRW